MATDERAGEVVAERYCPACRGHGTDVHECVELESAVVRKADLRHFLDVWIDNGMTENEDVEIVDRLWKAVQ